MAYHLLFLFLLMKILLSASTVDGPLFLNSNSAVNCIFCLIMFLIFYFRRNTHLLLLIHFLTYANIVQVLELKLLLTRSPTNSKANCNGNINIRQAKRQCASLLVNIQMKLHKYLYKSVLSTFWTQLLFLYSTTKNKKKI